MSNNDWNISLKMSDIRIKNNQEDDQTLEERLGLGEVLAEMTKARRSIGLPF